MPLRYYQVEQVESVMRAFQRVRAVLGCAATGTGKSTSLSEIAWRFASNMQRVLILAHREELLHQIADRIHALYGITAAFEKAERSEAHDVVPTLLEVGAPGVGPDGKPLVVVASVQSMVRRLDKFKPDHFGLVEIDECFPAGTRVGHSPIETIKAGDLVPSYDEASASFVLRKVVRTMRRSPSDLVRLWLQDGSAIVCTPEHPFLTASGWLPARACAGNAVLRMVQHEPMRDVWSLDEGVKADLLEGVSVRPGVAEAGRCGEEEDSLADRYDVFTVLSPLDHPPRGEASALATQCEEAGVLLRRVRQAVRVRALKRDDGADEYEVCQRADEGAEPDARSLDARARLLNAPQDRSQASGAGRKRPRPDQTAEGFASYSWVGAGVHRDDGPTWPRVPHTLQDRHRGQGVEDSSGDRRRVALLACAASTGPEEGGVASFQRVDRVEVLQRGSDGRYGGLCPDGLVYNLEVESTHTYVLGSGHVVHNCHHAAARTYRDIIDHFSGAKIFGTTATADRGDRVALGEVFDEVAFNYDMPAAIEDGWLVPIHQQTIETQHLDLTKVRTTAGDFNLGDLETAMTQTDLLHEIAGPFVEICGDRQFMMFAVTVEHAYLLAEAVREQIADRWRTLGRGEPPTNIVTALDGTSTSEERAAALDGFRRGEIQGLTNAMLLVEGVDLPAATVLGMCRPTKSRAFYQQAVGRVSRPLPGVVDAFPEREHATERRSAIALSSKPAALVVDFAGNAGKHKLIGPMDLLGGDYSEPEIAMAKGMLKRQEVKDILEALRRARAKIKEMEALRAQARKGYAATTVDPFDPLDVLGAERAGPQITEKQRRVLKDYGVENVERLSGVEATNLLKTVAERKAAKLADFNQIRTLMRKGGIRSDRAVGLTYVEAAEYIAKLARNGWRRPPSWDIKFGPAERA